MPSKPTSLTIPKFLGRVGPPQPPETTSPAVLAGAKFYARASAHRAVHGTIPAWDDGADEANWERTRQSVRNGCVDMVRGVLVAAEFPQRQSDAADRAISILDRSSAVLPDQP